MSKPFKHFNKHGYPLIEFLNDISNWLSDPPEFIYIMDFDGFNEEHIGVFIFNEIDRNYYKVEETGVKPRYTLDDCFPFTDYRALRTVTVHSVDIMPDVLNLKLERAYNLNVDLPRYRRWLAKYKPNRYK